MANSATDHTPQSPSQILTTLVEKYTRAQIEADMKRLTDAIEEHGREEQRHAAARVEAQRALATLEQFREFFDSVRPTEAKQVERAETNKALEIFMRQKGQERVTTRDRILGIIREHISRGREPDHGWTPAEFLEEFERQGTETNINLIRVTLRRMVRDGQLERDEGDGRYVLPVG
jgi:hypothetical protein